MRWNCRITASLYSHSSLLTAFIAVVLATTLAYPPASTYFGISLYFRTCGKAFYLVVPVIYSHSRTVLSHIHIDFIYFLYPTIFPFSISFLLLNLVSFTHPDFSSLIIFVIPFLYITLHFSAYAYVSSKFIPVSYISLPTFTFTQKLRLFFDFKHKY